MPPPLHPPRPARRSRTTATGVFGWIVIAVIGLSVVGGAINSARDSSSDAENGFDIPGGAVPTVAYESRSGLYAIDFPIAMEGEVPTERSEPMTLTASAGTLETNIASTSATGVADFEVQEMALRPNHPPAPLLAADRCNDNDVTAVLTEITVAGQRAWHCQWTSGGFAGNEVFLVVGETALVLRGVTLTMAFDTLGFDSPFNTMVNSLRILRPN